ncbi:MAG: hypothetical protein ACFB51_09315 [Anaerolineae bacterium]
MVQRGAPPRPEDDPIEVLDETAPADEQPELPSEEESEEMNAVEEEKDPVELEIEEEDKPIN